jgi:hypothetical protein
LTRPSFSTQPAPPWAAGTLIVAIGALACVVYLAAGRRDIGTSAFDVTFSPALAADTQVSLASRDVPTGHASSVSTAVARFSLWIARGRRSSLQDLAAVASALTVVMFGGWLRALGFPVFAVALTLLAMMMGQLSWWRGTAWSGDAMTPALAIGAAWAAMGWRARRSTWLAIVAVIAGVAAVWDSAGHPGVLGGPLEEFTALGLCIAAIGVGVLLIDARTRLTALLALITGAVLFLEQQTDLPLILFGWTSIAAALAWLVRTARVPNARAIVTITAVVLIAAPSLSRIRWSALGRDLDSSLAARAAYDVRVEQLPPGGVVIAESRRADTILRLSGIPIVPQTADDVDRALAAGMTPIALPQAQSHLEQLGFLFERTWLGNTRASIVAGHTPCTDLTERPRDVSLLVAPGSFILHGAAYGAAPGGAVVTTTNTPPALVTQIEPRSIPYDATVAAAATRIRVPRTDRREPVTLVLDRSPASAIATTDDGSAVTLCPGALRSDLMLGRRNTFAQLRMDDNAPFVTGWHPVEADPDFFRWTAANEAIVRITLAPAGPVRITVTATPASRPAQRPSIALRVNDCRLDGRAMAAGQGDYEWLAAEGCWKPGVNDVAIGVTPLISPASLFATHDTRLLGARIGAIRLARVNDQNAK